MKYVLVIAMVFSLNTVAWADKAADLRMAGELMEPDAYPEAQFGMAVEKVKSSDKTVVVVTTGAEFEIDLTESRVVCHQRLGMVRKYATITLPSESLAGGKILSRTDGAVIVDSLKARLRINGDSLLMFKPKSQGKVVVEVHFIPEYDSTFGNSPGLRDSGLPEEEVVGPGREGRLMLDNYGGIGLFPIGTSLEPYEDGKTTVLLKSDHILWLSVCPPRPFNWKQSFNDRPFMYGSCTAEAAYPSDEGIRGHLAFVGNIYYLHSCTMWNDWQTAFIPSRGAEEMKRVRETVHSLGARLMVYTPPSYFTKGTPNEKFATNLRMFQDTGKISFGTPWRGGENLSLFLAEIRRVIEEYGVDGLYFDGLYENSLVQSYRLMREARKILGDKRLLWIHTTWSPPGLSFNGYCPTIDTYADFVLRGEECGDLATNTLRQRYQISGYNISNSIGMPEFNRVPQSELNDAFVDAILDVNARFYYSGGLGRDRITNYYWPRLNDSLKERVERAMAERNTAITKPHILQEGGCSKIRGEVKGAVRIAGIDGVDDTEIDISHPAEARGTNNSFYMSACPGSALYPVIRFNLSPYAGWTVTGEAVLTFEVVGNVYAKGTLNMYPVLVDWNEGTLTWNTFGLTPGYGADDHGQTVLDSLTLEKGNGGTLELTIPEKVIQSWLDNPASNYGIIMEFTGVAEIYASEHTSGPGPRLQFKAVPPSQAGVKK